MKEPVLVAVIGVGGVLVGAVGGGLVQALLARGERRRAGRAAAVVLYIELHDAEKTVSDLRELRDWGEMITDWDAYAAIWALYRDRLASVLNTSRFAIVAAAFGCLASLKRSHQRDTQNPEPKPQRTPYVKVAAEYRRLSRHPDRHAKQPAPNPARTPEFGPEDRYLAAYLKIVQRAKRVVLKASFRWWEMRRRKHALAEQGPPELPSP